MDRHRVSRDRSTINSQLSTCPVDQVAEIIRRRGFFGYKKHKALLGLRHRIQLTTDVVFRIRLEYVRGADKGALPIGKVCLSGKTAVTSACLYA